MSFNLLDKWARGYIFHKDTTPERFMGVLGNNPRRKALAKWPFDVNQGWLYSNVTFSDIWKIEVRSNKA